GHRGGAMALEEGRGGARPRPPVGPGNGDPVRGGSGLRHGALVRAGPAVAWLHGVRRPDLRDAVRPRGLRVLPGGDLPGHLPLRLGPRVAVDALARGGDGRRQRHRVGDLRRHRQRVDEHAGRLRPRGEAGGERRSHRRDAQSRGPQRLVKGLDAFPPADRPPVAVVHLAFQVMVACGLAMAATALLGGGLYVRRRALPDVPWYLRLVTLCGPLGFVAIEAGWTVTEVGRQPWIIHGVMRTSEAVTPMPHLVVPFATFTVLYLFLAVVVVVLLRRQVFVSPRLVAPDQS